MKVYYDATGKLIATFVIGNELVGSHSSVDLLTDTGEILAANQQIANERIDTTAERARLRHVTPGSGQAMAYQEKGEEAADYIAAGYPADLTSYPFIQAEVNATGKTATEAADDIITQKAAWVTVGASIEEERLAGKKAVTDATTVSGVLSAYETAIAALDAI